jgi:hypothetical protein
MINLLNKYAGLKPLEKFGIWAGVASILGLFVGILTFGLPFSINSSNEILVQEGKVEAVFRRDVSDPTYEVYYPIPYQSPPELTWPNLPYDVRIIEQRADGFVAKFSGTFSGYGPPTWRAKGIRKK